MDLYERQNSVLLELKELERNK